MRRLTVVAVVATLLTGIPAVSHAQLKVSVAGGASPGLATEFPTNFGYHLQAGLELSFPALPIGVKVDGNWHRLALDGLDGTYQIFTGTVSAVFPLHSFGATTPYVIAGPGFYQLRMEPRFALDATKTSIGFNGGLGIRTVRNLFAEARVHTTVDFETVITPVTVGIRF